MPQFSSIISHHWCLWGTWMCAGHVKWRQIFTRTLTGRRVAFTSVWVSVFVRLPDMRPTSSMSSQPEKASLMLCIRATVDCLLFLVIWRDEAQKKRTECQKTFCLFLMPFASINSWRTRDWCDDHYWSQSAFTHHIVNSLETCFHFHDYLHCRLSLRANSEWAQMGYAFNKKVWNNSNQFYILEYL